LPAPADQIGMIKVIALLPVCLALAGMDHLMQPRHRGQGDVMTTVGVLGAVIIRIII
jgi:hypothetical protein